MTAVTYVAMNCMTYIEAVQLQIATIYIVDDSGQDMTSSAVD